jgi:hypothetical protein
MRALFGYWAKTVFLMLVLCGLDAGPVWAQSKSQNSTAATQKAMDELVDALSTAVAEKLKKDAGSSSKPAPPAAASEPAEPSEEARDPIKDFATRAEVALGGYPELWRTLARVPVALDESASSGRDLASFLALLCALVVAALGSEHVVRLAFDSVRRRLARRMVESLQFWPLIGLASLDALALAALWLGFLLAALCARSAALSPTGPRTCAPR